MNLEYFCIFAATILYAPLNTVRLYTFGLSVDSLSVFCSISGLIVVLLALNFPWTLASNESRSLTRLPVESRGLAFLTTNPDPPVLPPVNDDEFELDVVSIGRLVDNGDDVEVAGRRTTVLIVKGTRFWSAPFDTFFFTIFMKSVESRNSFYI